MFWAEVLDLPGCFASAESLVELRDALAESIGMYLSTADSYVRVTVHDLELSDDESRVLVS